MLLCLQKLLLCSNHKPIMLTLCSWILLIHSTRLSWHHHPPINSSDLMARGSYKMALHPGSSCNNSDSSTTSQLPDCSEPGNSLVPTLPILDRLKPSTKLHLSRKRQVEKPSTSTKKHKTGTANSTDPKSISPPKEWQNFQMNACPFGEENFFGQPVVKNLP